MLEGKLGHYRLLEKIGAGGMGDVYRFENVGCAIQARMRPSLGDVRKLAETKASVIRRLRNNPQIAGYVLKAVFR